MNQRIALHMFEQNNNKKNKEAYLQPKNSYRAL